MFEEKNDGFFRKLKIVHLHLNQMSFRILGSQDWLNQKTQIVSVFTGRRPSTFIILKHHQTSFFVRYIEMHIYGI